MRKLLLGLLLLLLLAGGAVVAVAARDARRAGAELRLDAPRQAVEDVAGEVAARVRPGTAMRPASCPEGVAGCRAASGRVVYVEAVDPDGDGDLHVVLASRTSITGPGLTAVDVAKDLRPARDPRVGDRATAAGPVQTGSHQQQQIHALRFRVRRR